MRELLIRYLLGELGADERHDLERRLAADAALRRELAHLHSCFTAACELDEPSAEPPRGLAERTTEFVVEEDDAGTDRAALIVPADPPAGALGWSLADLTVAGGVMLAVSMLLFPALGDSRNLSRRNECQNHHRQLGQYVGEYAQDHGNYLPSVGPGDNAGIYAVHLVDKGYVSEDEMAVLLVCPGSPQADEIRSGQLVIRIPSFDELRTMSPSEQAIARKNMSPMLAYRLPYRVGDRYYDIRHERLALSPVLSDAPGSEQEGLMSPNHGGVLIHVLCQDGSVRSFTSSTLPGLNDDLFRNVLGLEAAGVGRRDAVLGRSEATPAVNAALRTR